MHIEYFTWVFMILKEDFHGFSKSKVMSWVSIRIWHSKIIIDVSKEIWWVYELKEISWVNEIFKNFHVKTWVIEILLRYELYEIFLEFSSKTWVMRPLSREMSYSYETNVLSYEVWVMSMSTWVEILLLCIVLSLSVEIVDIAPRV